MSASTITETTDPSTDVAEATETQGATAALRPFMATTVSPDAVTALAALAKQLTDVGGEMAPTPAKPNPFAELTETRATVLAALMVEHGVDTVEALLPLIRYVARKDAAAMSLTAEDRKALTEEVTRRNRLHVEWLLRRFKTSAGVSAPKPQPTKAPAKAKSQYPTMPAPTSEWDQGRRAFYAHEVVGTWDWKTCEFFQANFAHQKELPQQIWFMLNFKKCGQFIEAVLRQALVLALVERERQAGKEDEYLALAADIEEARASEAANLAALAEANCGRVVDPTTMANPVHRVEVTVDLTPEEIEKNRIAFWASVPRNLRTAFKAAAANQYKLAAKVVRTPKTEYTAERILEMATAISVAERLLRVIQED